MRYALDDMRSSGFENSRGTKKEMEYAEAHNIPMFFFLKDAIEYFRDK